MSEVVTESDRLDQVLIQRQGTSDGARDLRHLKRMGEPCAVVVAQRQNKDLRLVLEPPEGLGVHDPVAIALKRCAQPAVRLRDRSPRRIGVRG
jgi:hypothetical protein